MMTAIATTTTSQQHVVNNNVTETSLISSLHSIQTTPSTNANKSASFV